METEVLIEGDIVSDTVSEAAGNRGKPTSDVVSIPLSSDAVPNRLA